MLVLALAACLGRGVAAQPYDRIERRNFWNAGRNINGLRTDSVSISFAQLQGGYESGGLRDSYMAPEGWSAGAEARTIMHLQKLSMKGAFSFVNFSGKDMCGSMSGRPGYYPVDILEFTPGGKTRQTYSFEGGITADLSGRWRLGGEIMFTSENYTKRKDLRHTNYLLDMTVAPSVMYHNGDFAAGLSYIFRKSSETVTAEVLGISSGSYYAFLDKGLMRGVYDIWDSQGTHLSETGVSGFPAKELSHGAALQLQWRSLYAELEYLRSEGSMGEKQNIWFRFPADRFAVRAGWSSGKGPIRNFIRAEAGMEDRRNYESVMESDTGRSDSHHRLRQEQDHAQPAVLGRTGIRGHSPGMGVPRRRKAGVIRRTGLPCISVPVLPPYFHRGRIRRSTGEDMEIRPGREHRLQAGDLLGHGKPGRQRHVSAAGALLHGRI